MPYYIFGVLLVGKDPDYEVLPRPLHISITYLLASKGLLWIGTNVGCVLTLPLPRLEGSFP